MPYFDGFVTAVPTANKEAYRKHAADALPLFKEFGATRMVEAWGDDVPRGTHTDFQGSVQAKSDETVVFSWMEYPDKATRNAAGAKIMSDPRMEQMGANMPFDGKRMIYGGFAPLVEDGAGGSMGYADGYLVPVAHDKVEAYKAVALKAAQVFMDHGATRVVEAVADDVPDGKVTDFRMAVKATDDETVVFSFVEWPSKEVRTAGLDAVMKDERMQPDPDEPMPFDGKRMIYGGFAPIVDA